jgi:Alkylmercury lyase
MSRDTNPVPAMAPRTGRLSGPARLVHQAVLAAFTATGQPPPAADLDRLIHADGGDPDQVRAKLTRADLLAFTPGGEIRAAYPFSPAPTLIRVRWNGGPEVHAMCAIDALGMSAMLGRPVAITAAEPGTGRAITVAVDGDQARWAPRTAVVLADDAGEPGCPSADRCCGHISFFTTGRAARTWARRHPEVTGTVLRRAGALRIGITTFGACCSQPAARRSAETSKEPAMASAVSHPVFARAIPAMSRALEAGGWPGGARICSPGWPARPGRPARFPRGTAGMTGSRADRARRTSRLR